MNNVEMKIVKDVLTITVNLKAPGKPSASGKSSVIATTSGNIAVLDTEFKIGLSVYKKA